MNKIVNMFLLADNKFMPEMQLKQSGFTYSACGLFTKNKERIQKLKETGDTKYVYKNAWVVPLKDKKGVSVVNAFQKILDDSNRKPNKIWVDKGSECYYKSFKKWLKVNAIEMYSIHNKENYVAAERFVRTLKT